MDSAAKTRARLAWSWTALLCFYLAAAPFLWDRGLPTQDELIEWLPFIVGSIVMTALGSVLYIKVPDNRMYWIFLGTGLGMVLSATTPIPETAPIDPGLPDYLALVYENALSAMLLFYLLALMFYLFPTGHFLTRRWRWAGWFGRVAFPLLFLLSAFQEELGPAFVEDGWRIANPIGFIPLEFNGTLLVVVFAGLYIVVIGSLVALVVRYRRGSATVRAQIKWLILPAIGFQLGFFSIVFTEGEGLIGGLLFVSSYILIPAAITVAITRYRLFDIDRIISRTLAYALVVGVLVVLFAVLAVWLPSLLLGDSPPLFVAGATLAVAASFNPVRRRIQQIVDRRFNRSAYEARVLAEEFGTTVRGSLSIEELGDLWSTTVEDALQPNIVGLWIREPSSR